MIMSRYQQMQAYDASHGQEVKVVLRNSTTHGTMTIEDKIVDIHARGEGARQVIDSIEFDGFVAGVSRPLSGWMVESIERKLPPLPTKVGSAVLVDGRVAVLREDYDSQRREWIWARNAMVGPSEAQLDRADILYEAP